MTSELEKIDLLRARTGISYKKAREALETAQGDVVEALIELEKKNCKLGEKIQRSSEDVWEQLRSIIQKGYKTKIRLKKDNRTVVEVPATLGAVGVLGILSNSQLALLGAVGTIAAVANNYTLDLKPNSEQNYMGVNQNSEKEYLEEDAF